MATQSKRRMVTRMSEQYAGEDYSKMETLKCMPTAWITKETCERAVDRDGMELEYVPYDMKTADMCARAVEQVAEAIAYVPEKFVTLDMCKSATKKSGRVYKILPDAFKKDPVVMMGAIESYPSTIRDVDQTRDRCELAVFSNPLALAAVRDEFKTLDMCRTAVKRNVQMASSPDGTPSWGVAAHIPKRYKNDEKIVKSLEELYRLGGFEKLGSLRVQTEQCRQSYPCRHGVVFEDGTYHPLVSGKVISDSLVAQGLSHSHFDEYIDSNKVCKSLWQTLMGRP